MQKNLFQPLNDAEIELLDDLLLEYANDSNDCILNISELNGFLTAVVSSPEPTPPSKWLKGLWDGQDPDWESEEAFQLFMNLLFRFYNATIGSLRSGREGYSAYFSVVEHEDDDIYYTVDEWCLGYLIGQKTVGLHSLPTEIQPYLDTIKRYADLDTPVPESAQDSKQVADLIVTAALAIYEYIDKSIYQPSLPMRSSKIGANEPCPCGSGKKFKKCCRN